MSGVELGVLISTLVYNACARLEGEAVKQFVFYYGVPMLVGVVMMDVASIVGERLWPTGRGQ